MRVFKIEVYHIEATNMQEARSALESIIGDSERIISVQDKGKVFLAMTEKTLLGE